MLHPDGEEIHFLTSYSNYRFQVALRKDAFVKNAQWSSQHDALLQLLLTIPKWHCAKANAQKGYEQI